MRRLLFIALVWVPVMLAASATRAHDFVLSVEQGIDAQSNTFQRPFDPISDAAYVISPVVRFREQSHDLTYDLLYKPSFQQYFRTDGISGWDHSLRGDGSYLFGPADMTRAGVFFNRRRLIRDSFVEDPVSQPTAVTTDRGRVTAVDLRLEQVHSFTEKLNGSARVGFDHYGYEQSPNVDTRGLNGALTLSRMIAARSSIGLDVGGSYRVFEAKGTRPGSQSTVVNANLVVAHEITPTIKLSVQGGPSYIRSHQSPATAVEVSRFRLAQDPSGSLLAAVFDGTPVTGCARVNGEIALLGCRNFAPVDPSDPRFFERVTVDFDPGASPSIEDEAGLTYFASAKLSKQLSKGQLMVEFVREEDAASGLGASTIRSSLTVGADWRPVRRWRVAAYGNWNRRESFAEFSQSVVRGGQSVVSTGVAGQFFAESNGLIPNVVPNDVDIRQFWAQASVTRWLSDRISILVRFRYIRQDAGSSLDPDTSVFDNYIGTLSLKYEFEAYTF